VVDAQVGQVKIWTTSQRGSDSAIRTAWLLHQQAHIQQVSSTTFANTESGRRSLPTRSWTPYDCVSFSMISKIGTSRTICPNSSNFAIHIQRHTHIHHVELFRLPLQTRSEEASPTIFNAPTHKFRFGQSDHLGDLDCLIPKKNFFPRPT